MTAIKSRQKTAISIKRPVPPNLGDLYIAPAVGVSSWVKDTFLEPRSKLFNQDHYHLYDFIDADIGFLWAVNGFTKQMKYVVGQTELVSFRVSGFQRMRQEQQMQQWFGGFIPKFIITLDADYCKHCSDSELCALVEHELYHIGHELDAFGMPAFSRDTGLPKLAMRDHDVSEFIGVVARYGKGNKDSSLSRLVDVANRSPEVSNVDISHACGTCLSLVV